VDGGYQELERRWKALRGTRGLRVREVACVGAPRTLLCAESGEADQPVVALAAGIHGDEPAAAWALLDFVEREMLDERFAFRIWPCTNPTGYERRTRHSIDEVDVNRTFGRGGKSPEARAILTANRDRAFVLAVDLHEDCDATGFYCYDYADVSHKLGERIVGAVANAGFPLQDFSGGFDLGVTLPEDKIHFAPGLVYADPAAEAEALGAQTYSLILARRAAKNVLTFETPGGAAWESRLAMHQIALQAAIAAL
jgi:hypothetical protein